ncbi:MAG: endonuclease, partial [Marmoricola sp.]|nr:endonuclease [Marmoricola sp.]
MQTTGPDLETATAVLAFARARRGDAERAEADVLLAAVSWAEQHPPESIELAATWVAGGGDTGLPLAGPGAPLVAEFCIAEFALAIGRSTDSGRGLIADAVELKYRFPRHWD